MSKNKISPVLITTRQGLESTVADVVKLKLDLAQATAAMEKEIAEVQKRHVNGLLSTARQIESRESGVLAYCQQHRAELFPEKKSLELLLATIGFETTPPRVEKLKSRDTWGKIALRLKALFGPRYVRERDPEVDKEKLIADRKEVNADKLASVGLEIVQDENFFIRPKSQVAEASVKEAA